MSTQLSPRFHFRLHPLTAVVLGLLATPVLAADEPALPEVTVAALALPGAESTEDTGFYTTTSSRSATGLPLSLRQTPQTTSVISRSQLDDFRLTSVNDALENGSAISVEQIETDRTYYTARGFDVTQFQFDGVGLPFAYELVHGDLDTALYDRIDVVYGATGLMTGTGMPSAAVNFVRKRTGSETRRNLAASVGSWNSYRVDADVNAKITTDGCVRARVVGAYDSSGSWLDRYRRNKGLVYGIIEADLSDRTRLAVGHVQQHNEADGALWGALPLLNSDGSRTDYPASTSSSASWAYWNSAVTSTFAEVHHKLGGDWTAQATVGRDVLKNNGKLFYVYGTPDAATGEGLFAWPSLYASRTRQTMADVALTGSTTLFGLRHELNLGGQWAYSTLTDRSDYGDSLGAPVPALDQWDGAFPEPSFTNGTDGSDFSMRRQSIVLADRVHLSRSVKLIAGGRWTRADVRGSSYQVPRNSSADDVTPYAGLVYDVNDTLSLYASHARVFDPQYETAQSGEVLQPVQGRSTEAGLKMAFNRDTATLSLAWFDVVQRGLADGPIWEDGRNYYRPIDAESRGVQLDLSGRLTDRWQAALAFTGLSLQSPEGKDVRTFVPRQLLRLSTRYRLPGLDALVLGAQVNWQSDTWAEVTQGTQQREIRQEAYALLNLMARYELTRQLSAQLNLNNVTNEKYLSSLYWASLGQGYYGAPRNVTASLSWNF